MLKKALELRGIEICNQWFSSFLITKPFEEVEKDFEGYRDEFKWQLVKSAIVKDYDVKVEAEDMKREGAEPQCTGNDGHAHLWT